MPRTADKHGVKAGKPDPKAGVRNLRRSMDAACDLFLMRRGSKAPGAFRFGAKRVG
jgi:hypothetical protein